MIRSGASEAQPSMEIPVLRAAILDGDVIELWWACGCVTRWDPKAEPQPNGPGCEHSRMLEAPVIS